MTTDLMKNIDSLSREQAIEAASFVASSIGADNTTHTDAAALLVEWSDRPYQHLSEAEELARLLLSVSAATPDLEPIVREAIAGAGRKQVVLAGGEIVALAALALGALQAILSKGRTSEQVSETIEKGPDGKETVVRTRNTTWGISSTLGELLKRALATTK